MYVNLSDIKVESAFNDLIEDKNILYIPIVSSINRKTNLYNLDSDGNINRTITTFLRNHSFAKLTIVLPKSHTPGTEYLIDTFKKEFEEMSDGIVEIIWSDFFGIHAGEQRSNPYLIQRIIDDIMYQTHSVDFSDWDYVIADSQYLLLKLVSEEYVEEKRLIFWNYLSSTNLKSRSFTRDYDDVTDALLRSEMNVIVTSPDLLNYARDMKGRSKGYQVYYIPVFMDRKFKTFNYSPKEEILEYIEECAEKNSPIIYLPYRLTDEAYRIDDVMNFINDYIFYHIKCYGDKVVPVQIVYSDPNNSGMMDSVIEKQKDFFKQYINDGWVEIKNVSPDRATFYTFIDSQYRINIPYLEDIGYANHAAVWEFLQSRANVYVSEDFARNKNPYRQETDIVLFKSIDDFKYNSKS